jgi:protein TonB
VLAGCVAASVLLHAMVLFSWPGLREGGKSSSTLQVMTATIAPRMKAPTPEQPEPVVKTEPRKPEVPNPRKEVETRQSLLTAAAEAKSPATIQAPVPAPVTPPAPAPVAPIAPSQQARPVEPSPATASSSAAASVQSEMADAGSLDQYRLALISAARRYKRYPAQAMERGWQGKVEIRLVIGADGRIKTASVRTGSGHGILDQQALDMITKGKTLAQIPPALRGKDFVVDVPVIFDLQAS